MLPIAANFVRQQMQRQIRGWTALSEVEQREAEGRREPPVPAGPRAEGVQPAPRRQRRPRHQSTLEA